jgi:hypothetical protein
MKSQPVVAFVVREPVNAELENLAQVAKVETVQLVVAVAIKKLIEKAQLGPPSIWL